MDINRGKCDAWVDLLLAIVKLSKDLNKEECKYVKGCFFTALGNLELQELDKNEILNKYKKKEG